MLTSSATDAKNTVKEGVVFKKGEGFMSGWKQRYLILYSDKRLSYFIMDGLELKGSIFINNTAPSNISESNKGNKSEGANYGFYIQTSNRKWEFAVKSFQERDNWIKNIRATIEGTIEPQFNNNNNKPNSPAFDINQSMPLPNRQSTNNNSAIQPQIKQQPQKQQPVHNRKTSKSAYYDKYYNHNQYTQQQQQQQPKSPMQTQQQQQYNNYNYGQQQQQQYNQQYTQQQQQQYNQYNQQQYNQQQTTHRSSVGANNGYNNGYNNYYQKQQSNQPPPAWNKNKHSYNNSGSMNKYSQKQQTQKPKRIYKPSFQKSVYAGFKIRKYDNSTRFSHLCSGYLSNLFPLKLQNLCQEYLGYFWFNNNELPFKNSELLNTNELKIKMIKLLCNGMNKYFIKKIDLIYNGSKDGLNAKSFHQKCDGHGQTLVLLYTNYGTICGGYTNIPWSKDNKYHTDKNAFLFSLNNSNKIEEKEQLFTIKESEIGHAVLHYKEYGPTWGYGHDLAVFSLSENNLNTQSCNSSYSFISFQLIGGWMYCKVMKCEVFKIYTS